MKNLLSRNSTNSRTAFLSPKYLLQRAVLISVAFLAAHLASLREFTSLLNGTPGSTTVNPETATLFGVTYIALYLGFVLLVPVLLIAALLLTIRGFLRERKTFEFRTVGEVKHPIAGASAGTPDCR
jgi:hypothetical protein